MVVNRSTTPLEISWPRFMMSEVWFFSSRRTMRLLILKRPLGYLGSVGVTTPVSTVHTWVNIRANPALCGADFVGANAQYVSSSIDQRC